MQRALIQYRNPENYELVKEALLKCHREDLIGFGPEYLIPLHKMKNKNTKSKNTKSKNIKNRNSARKK